MPQTIFKILRSTRNLIECADGRTTASSMGNFDKIDFKLETIPTIILACLLYITFVREIKNVLIKNYFRVNKHVRETSTSKKENLPDPIYSGNTAEENVIRSLLTEYDKH